MKFKEKYAVNLERKNKELNTLFNIVAARFENLLNFDVCVV